MDAHRGIRTRALALAIVAAIASTGFLAVSAAPAGAATTAPVLTLAPADRGKVAVSWSFTNTDSPKGFRLEIERTSDVAGTRVVIKRKGASKTIGSLLDKPKPGLISYRARLVYRGDPLPWGPTVQIRVGTAPPPTDGSLPPRFTECASSFSTDALALVNGLRADIEVAAMSLHAQLQSASRIRAIKMGVEGELSHDGWLDALAAAGYTGASVGETIVVGAGTSAAAVNAFFNSPPHKAIMLNATYRSFGAGCVRDENGVPWISFGSR